MSVEDTKRTCARFKQPSTDVFEAQERERDCVSRHLRDHVSQDLAAVSIQMDLLLGKLSPELQDKIRDQAQSIRQLSAKAATDAHRLSSELRPSALDDLGVEAALRSHARTRAGLDVAMVVEDLPQRVPEPIATCVFRVVEDILRGLEETVGAQGAAVRVWADNSRILLSVEPDPVPDKAPEYDSLCSSVQQRLAALKGSVEIESRASNSVVLRISLPLQG